jgi:hypothetical protein
MITDETITGIVVTHNTKDLFQRAYESVRKFHPGMKIIIVNGSDKNNPCRKYVESLSDDKTMVIKSDVNIGHGRGINWALGFVKTPYALIFDSDIEMIKSPVEEMMTSLEDDIYGVGTVIKTDLGGFNFGERPDESKLGSMKYLQPYFCLIQIAEYKKYAPFIHHGAPAVSTCLDIRRRGLDKAIKNFDLSGYIKHDFYGTRGVRVAANKPEIEDEWDKVIKPNSITCITCTGDRIVAFDLCARWMQDQTIIPSQWIVIDDGKIPMANIPKNCEYIRREPQKNDPLHTMVINLKLALSKVTGDKIIIIEDDEYYAPEYIKEMSKQLNGYDLVGIGKSKYYNIQAFKYYQHNGKEFSDHASLAQTAFKKSLIPSILGKMNGDQFLDIRIWQGLKGNAHILVDDKESLYVGMKGLPGRSGIGSGHNPNMEGYKNDNNKTVLKEWIKNKKHLDLYLDLKIKASERRESMGTYKAIGNGGHIQPNSPHKSSLYGVIRPGTVFTYEGPKGSWMQPIDEPEKKIVPVEELPFYAAAKKIADDKGDPALDQTPLSPAPKLKGKKK